MEIPAKKRKRVVVLAKSPMGTRVLVKRDHNNLFWNVPDTHLHWPIARPKCSPSESASYLMKDCTLGILGDVQDIHFSSRKKLPTGGFSYEYNDAGNLLHAIDMASRVRKHLKLKNEEVEMHNMIDIIQPNAHAKYGGGTIEAIRMIYEE